MPGVNPSQTLRYKRSRFTTQLPMDYLYSPSHAWIARHENVWRVGLTKFATRMLGELVDHGFEVQPGAPVVPGQVIGWIEGFKAISDVFCIAKGNFVDGNVVLRERIALMDSEPYAGGWLYMVDGEPDDTCMDVHRYAAILDKTIDRILERQKGEQIE